MRHCRQHLFEYRGKVIEFGRSNTGHHGVEGSSARLKHPRSHASARSRQDNRDGPAVLSTSPFDETLGVEAINEPDRARVRQAKHRTQLSHRSAVEELMQRS